MRRTDHATGTRLNDADMNRHHALKAASAPATTDAFGPIDRSHYSVGDPHAVRRKAAHHPADPAQSAADLVWESCGLHTTYRLLGRRKHMSAFSGTREQRPDVNEAIVVLSGREYPPALLGISDVDTPIVLDCGGHIGTFSLYVRTINPSALLYVLEPLPENVEMLKTESRHQRHRRGDRPLQCAS